MVYALLNDKKSFKFWYFIVLNLKSKYIYIPTKMVEIKICINFDLIYILHVLYVTNQNFEM